MKAKATLRMRFSSKEKKQIIADSLGPEVSNSSSHRSKVSLHDENGLLVLEIEASDTTALRASLNSYLRWINSILDVLEKLKSH